MSICIGCQSPNSVHVLRKNGRELREANIEIVRCAECRLAYLSDWAGEFDAALYDYYARRGNLPEERIYNPLNTRRHHELLTRLATHLVGKSMLDVGCGEGHLVRSALADGWAAIGIDLSAAAIHTCETFNLPCSVLDFFAPSLDRRRFDLITMSELIEHVPAPGRFLARAESLLVPGGLLYVTTPNFGSLTRAIAASYWKEIHREHLSYFTPNTFMHLVHANTSFALDSLETRNIGVASVLARFRAGRDSKPNMSGHRQSEQGLRGRIETSRGLQLLKTVLNGALSATRTGDTIVACLRRR